MRALLVGDVKRQRRVGAAFVDVAAGAVVADEGQRKQASLPTALIQIEGRLRGRSEVRAIGCEYSSIDRRGR